MKSKWTDELGFKIGSHLLTMMVGAFVTVIPGIIVFGFLMLFGVFPDVYGDGARAQVADVVAISAACGAFLGLSASILADLNG